MSYPVGQCGNDSDARNPILRAQSIRSTRNIDRFGIIDPREYVKENKCRPKWEEPNQGPDNQPPKSMWP